MRTPRKNLLLAIALAGILIALLPVAGCGTASTPVELNVSAAASLTDALKTINDLYMQEHQSVRIVANFASSGTLQKQIEQGAPVDIFISAGAKQMQALQDGGLILNETRANLLGNKVVLVVPGGSALSITGFMDLADADVARIAIGDPDSVPAGTYGKEALVQLGIYDVVEPRLVLCADVRQVLSYVEAGNADAGLVYATDAAISPGVRIVADAPAEVNNKIIYPIAVIKASKNAAAAGDYIAYLSGPEAKTVFEQYGFIVVSN